MSQNEKLGLHEEQDIERSFDLEIMKKLAVFTKPYLKLLVLSAVLLIAVTGIDLVRPLLIKIVIDDHIHGYEMPYVEENGTYKRIGKDDVDTAGQNLAQLYSYENQYYLLKGYDASLYSKNEAVKPDRIIKVLSQAEWSNYRETDKQGIVKLAVIFFSLVIVGFVMTYIQLLLLNHVSQKLICDMRAHLFNHLLKLPLSFYDKNPVGRLVTRVTNDMKNISDMYTDVLINLLNDLLLLFGTLIIMLSLNWKLTLVALSTVPLVILASYWFRIKAREAHRAVKAKIARINAVLSENIGGMRIIQLFHREKEAAKEFDAINADHLASSMREIQVFGIFRPSMNLLYTLALTLLIWYAGPKAIVGQVELGVLFALINYTDQFFKPIFDLSEKFNILQSAMASSERVFMLLEENETEPEGITSVKKENVKGHVVFENLNFGYTATEPVLKDINLEILPGQTVALVGATGSGKTTIISLLSGLYSYQSGDIRIDGHSVKDMKKSDLRSLIGVVLQDVFLFAGDIKTNISLGNDAIDIAQIKEMATYVNAADFIERLPKGYEEVVYERGSTLSSGQRQLLSFARALAYDPKILILDEATSNIDTETEHLIQDAIEKLSENRTTIVIAHRLSTIQKADQIIVLHKGRIRESGTHEALLEKGGLYYDLYRLQYEGYSQA